MSKRKGKIKLKIGRFYNVRDGSDKGHPGKVFNIDYQNGEYDSIVTETTYRKGLISIKPTDEMARKSFIKSRPFKGTRNDYGDKEYSNMQFDENAYLKAEKVKKRFFRFGLHYKKKHRMK